MGSADLRLSILIPFRGATTPLEETLLSVLENRPADCEILIGLCQPYDDPYGLADELTFVDLAGLSTADALNSLVRHAQAPVVHVLSCGVTVCEGWTEPALAAFRSLQVAAVAPAVVTAQRSERVHCLGLGNTCQRREFKGAGRTLEHFAERSPAIAGPSLWAGFYRTQALSVIGGFSPAAGNELLDLDLALRLSAAGFRARAVSQSVVTLKSAAPASEGAVAAGRHAERLFWRHTPRRGLALQAAGHLLGNLARGVVRPLETCGRFAALAGAVGLRRQCQTEISAGRQWLDWALQDQPAIAGRLRIDAAHDLDGPATPATTRSRRAA